MFTHNVDVIDYTGQQKIFGMLGESGLRVIGGAEFENDPIFADWL